MVVEVVAAVFQREEHVLCLRRSAGRALSGHWEFPGGKVEVNESRSAALIREIKEELCVDIEVGDYLGESLHPADAQSSAGSTQQIRLHAFMVEHWSGHFELIDHDKLLWSSASQMRTLNWSPADVPFVELLCARAARPG